MKHGETPFGAISRQKPRDEDSLPLVGRAGVGVKPPAFP